MTGAPDQLAVARLERLCYGGETLVDAATVAGGTVGVTTHRVLVLSPAGDDATFSDVARPNVRGVVANTAGDRAHGARSLRFGAYAAFLLVASLLVNVDSVGSFDVSTQTGAGPVVGLAMAAVGLLTLVDDALRYAGLAFAVLALAFAARYGYSRKHRLAIQVTGGDPLTLPMAPGEHRAVDRLTAALEKASNASEG